MERPSRNAAGFYHRPPRRQEEPETEFEIHSADNGGIDCIRRRAPRSHIASSRWHAPRLVVEPAVDRLLAGAVHQCIQSDRWDGRTLQRIRLVRHAYADLCGPIA